MLRSQPTCRSGRVFLPLDSAKIGAFQSLFYHLSYRQYHGDGPLRSVVLGASLLAALFLIYAADAYGGSKVPDHANPAPGAALEKFDDGLYQKIQDLIEPDSTGLQAARQAIEETEGPQGASGAHDEERHYNIIIVVGRDGANPDETARQNKESLVEYLTALGARDIVPAGSLSFVTASVPVSEIPALSLYDEIYQIGDGELPVTPAVDTARHTIRATPPDLRQSAGWVPDGTGVVVAVIDTGINSTYLDGSVADRICGHCSVLGDSGADPVHFSPVFASHGTQVAQIIAASGMAANNGMAPGTTLLDARYGGDGSISSLLGGMAHALDWSFGRGADVVNISAGADISCNAGFSTAYNTIINEAVHRGMTVVKSAGNAGGPDSGPEYRSVTSPGCARNVIAVGGIDDRRPDLAMYVSSSRGPVSYPDPRLAPHMVAPAIGIQTLDYSANDTTSPRYGTSLATPQVSAAAAMLLQDSPDLSPAGVRAALLLGADWTGPVPCTSAQYEMYTPGDPCSYAMQPADFNTANNAESLRILNNAGFGVLDVAGSLRHAGLPHRIIPDHLDEETATRTYGLDVSDAAGPVKVILTWMVDPVPPFADLDMEIVTPKGRVVDAGSVHQTTEFAVFDPPGPGKYEVRVHLRQDQPGGPQQAFVLAATHPLMAIPPSSSPPLTPDMQINADLASESRITPEVYDPDGGGAAITDVSGAILGEIDTSRLPLIIYRSVSTGVETLTYAATDDSGSISGGTITVYINEPGNTRPVLGDIAGAGVRAGRSISFTAAATDADGNPLTFGIANAPDGAAIDGATGYFSWMPSESQSGTHNVTITVYDSRGGADWQDVAIRVLPSGATGGDLPSGGGTAIIPVSDAFLDRIADTYMSRGLVVPAGVLLGTGNASYVISGDITHTVYEDGAVSLGVVRPDSPGTAPVPAGGHAARDRAAAGFLYAGIVINATDAGSPGIVRYMLSDDAGQNGNATLSVFVGEIGNVPPVLSGLGGYSINAQNTLIFEASATDFGGGTVSYRLSGAPAGAEISGDGIFSWTPGSRDVGSHTFAVTAYDAQGASDSGAVTVRVFPAGTPNQPPTAPDVAATVAPGGRILIIPAVSDPDGEPAVIISTTATAGGATTLSGNSIEYTAGPAPVTEAITYAAADGRGGVSTGMITITIR